MQAAGAHLAPLERTSSAVSDSTTTSPSTPSASRSTAPPVRLPPVAVPPQDFLPVGFNPERRQSINSDPILHAFSAISESHPAVDFAKRFPHDEGSHGLTGSAERVSANEVDTTGRGNIGMNSANGTRPPSQPSNEMPRFPPPPGFDAQPNYQFGSSFASTSQPPPPQALFPGPTSTYRFGGPSVTASAPLDAPSYFDYSMRRHSLSNNIHGGPSPERQLESGGGGAGGAGPTSPIGSSKRKSSGEDEKPSSHDGSYYQTQNIHPSYATSSAMGNPPPSKRRTSSLAVDSKMNGLALNEQHRRESFSPTWEDRRDSGGSYASSSSQGYGGYQHQPNHHPHHQQQHPHHPPLPPTSSAGYDQRQAHMQPQHPPPPPGGFHHGQFYDNQVGPRGSIARGMYEPEGQDFGRRPSIPGVSQMMQGQAPFYPGQLPPPPPPHLNQQPPHTAHSFPQPPPPPGSRGSLTQPSVMVSSVPHTPTEQDEHQSRPNSNGFPIGPPPQWPRSGGNPPAPPPHPTRQNSAGSLDPNSAYQGAGGSAKDSPYSRSPELRVSHKLAERKRRKEMAQLFDDLREALPVDRGLKSSKWEILSKAIDYIGQLKTYTHDLQTDNQNLRAHFNLPSAPSSAPGLEQDFSRPNQPSTIPAHSTPASPHHSFSGLSQPHPASHPSQVFGQANPSPPLTGHSDLPSNGTAPSPRPHPSRNGSHASSHASSLSIDNGIPPHD